MSPDKVMLNSEEIKPVALAILSSCICLKALVSCSSSQSVENSVKKEIFKFNINLVEGFMVDPKTFLG